MRPCSCSPHGQPASPVLLPCLLVVALAVLTLTAPMVAADVYHVNSMACPMGENVIHVNATTYPNLTVAYDAYGPDKTYVLAPGSYVVSEQIFLDSRDSGVTPSTTCFIGGGARAEVVVTASPSLSEYVFRWYSSGPAISLGLKGLILDNGGTAAGVYIEGRSAAWSIEDVTIRNGIGALYSESALSSELANVTVEHIQGVWSVYHSASQVIQWSDLTVTDCDTVEAAVFLFGMDLVIAGRVYLARNRAQYDGGSLFVRYCRLDFTGNVMIEGNEAVDAAGGGAHIRDTNIRFTESSTLLVHNNVASQSSGGGFFVQGSAVSILGGSGKFINNTAGDVGGAVYLRSTSRMDMGSVCIQQNAAANGGSGMYLAGGSTVTFTSPADAQIGDNVPADSSIFVEAGGASWTCSGPGTSRGAGVYEVQGPVCACTDAAAAGGSTSCLCPATSRFWGPAACACGVCDPASGPCCSATAQLAPCIRSLELTPGNAASSVCEAAEVVATVTDNVATSSPTTPPDAAPAVNVPVTFAVDGDCDPDMRTRTVFTDTQGHARIMLRAQKPGAVVVVATVRSGGSLPTQVVKAITKVRFWPCHPADRKPGRDTPYGDDDSDAAGGYARRPEYKHTSSRARRYEADGDDATAAEAFEAVATQMALQAMEEHEAGQAAVSGGGTV